MVWFIYLFILNSPILIYWQVKRVSCVLSNRFGLLPGTADPHQRHENRRALHRGRRRFLPVRSGIHAEGGHKVLESTGFRFPIISYCASIFFFYPCHKYFIIHVRSSGLIYCISYLRGFFLNFIFTIFIEIKSQKSAMFMERGIKSAEGQKLCCMSRVKETKDLSLFPLCRRAALIQVICRYEKLITSTFIKKKWNNNNNKKEQSTQCIISSRFICYVQFFNLKMYAWAFCRIFYTFISPEELKQQQQ